MPALVPPPYSISPAAFDQAGIDRMAEFRDDPALVARLWSHEHARAAVVHSGRALLEGDELLLLPTSEAPAGEPMLLGVLPDGPVFVVHPSEPLDDDRARGIRAAAGRLAASHLALFMQAVALTGWHERHPHCSSCGTVTTVHDAGYARRCPNDSSEHYPRTDPAVIVLVLDGGPRARTAACSDARRHGPRAGSRHWQASSSPVRPSRTPWRVRLPKKSA